MHAPKQAYEGVYNRRIKRVIGLLLAVPLLLLLLPAYLVICAAIVLDDGFPVFYRPLRGGYRGKPFIAGKFGTVGVNKKRCLECA